MAEYKGMSFPYIFSKLRKTSKVEDIDKVRAKINLIIRQQCRKLLFRPDVGVDWDAIFFVDEVQITKDFMYSYINEALANNVEDVTLEDISLTVEEDTLTVHFMFMYHKANAAINAEYRLGGDTYE